VLFLEGEGVLDLAEFELSERVGVVVTAVVPAENLESFFVPALGDEPS